MSFEHTITFDEDDGLDLVIDGSRVGPAEGEAVFRMEAGTLCCSDVTLVFRSGERRVRRLSTEAVDRWKTALKHVAEQIDRNWPMLERAQDAWDAWRHDYYEDAA